MVQFREKPRATFILLETFLNRKNSNWVDITQIIILRRVTINHKHFIAFSSFQFLVFGTYKKEENGEQKIYENGYTINEKQKITFFYRNAYTHTHIRQERGTFIQKEATKRR